MTNTEYEILYNTFFQNGNMNHLEEYNSVNYGIFSMVVNADIPDWLKYLLLR